MQNLGVLRFEATGMLLYNIITVTADRARQECDPPAGAAPNGMGLVSYLAPTLYDHAGGFHALNSRIAYGGLKIKYD